MPVPGTQTKDLVKPHVLTLKHRAECSQFPFTLCMGGMERWPNHLHWDLNKAPDLPLPKQTQRASQNISRPENMPSPDEAGTRKGRERERERERARTGLALLYNHKHPSRQGLWEAQTMLSQTPVSKSYPSDPRDISDCVTSRPVARRRKKYSGNKIS